MPDPAAVRLCFIPDSAPPYDDEKVAPGQPGPAGGSGRQPSGQHSPGQHSPGQHSSDQDAVSQHSAGQETAGQDSSSQRPSGQRPSGQWPSGQQLSGQDLTMSPTWPSRFAQVLAETLAGSRPPRQMVPWTTEHARTSIQRLGPQLAAGERPRVRRVLTSHPASDVLEMTVVVGFGARVRALAVRLERAGPAPAAAGRDPQVGRWLCTAVEAA